MWGITNRDMIIFWLGFIACGLAALGLISFMNWRDSRYVYKGLKKALFRHVRNMHTDCQEV